MLDTILFMLILVGNYQRTGESIFRWRFDKERARTLLREGWVLILGGVAVSLYMRIDQVMLAQMIPGAAGEAAVGVYSAAVRLSEAWYFVPGAIVTSTFSTIILTKKQSETLYRARVQRLFKMVVLISYVFAIGLTLFSGLIIDILLGAEYAEAAPMLIVLAWAGVWTSLGVARNPMLHAENVVTISMQTTIMGAATNILLNIFMIPLWGAMGSAIATLIAQFVAAHLSTYLFKQTRFLAIYQTQALLNPNPFRSVTERDPDDH
jgi:PST family polysaccharide transporter